MKRPHLVHFLSIKTDENLHIKCSMTLKENLIAQGKNPGFALEIAQGIAKGITKEIPKPRFPIQAFRMLVGEDFKMKIIGLDDQRNEIYKKVFESDNRGQFNFKIPLNEHRNKISVLQIYEVGISPGLEIHLGTFIPLIITDPKKIVICDFDKTLVDTKYSTTKELYRSLTKPLDYFPTVTRSVSVIKNYIKEGFHPFILSASPHFYEDAMRDWLYQNQIYSAGIFLKDYRQVFNFFDGDLTPKDLKIQGLYKLNHLLDILMMTGIPHDLVLMGDNFESDPIIYLSLSKLISESIDPWKLWKELSGMEVFQMNKKQSSQLLNKFYQLSNDIKKWKAHDPEAKCNLKIWIRKKVQEDKISVPDFFDQELPLIELYEGMINSKEVLEQREE
ncbi:MAG: hypothetical protein GY909_07620 [Oligoflexia bacterium]|nr:hypothetical protein [Oligoflexia bacterium]